MATSCIIRHMLTVVETETYADWVASLKDDVGAARIAARIGYIRFSGNFGDAKSVGGGVSELRFSFGPGYRVYFCRRGTEIIILLGGGDKGSNRMISGPPRPSR